ncbi:hypothetical protein [Sphingomonas sp. BAUL-RG-20F-R05-02]|uniref:hypothetical protein n=1 Tax=Sphingomonas sp. BAUL-RG-20F-R05-02 TaxID=2914830 RepID=UPI001F5AD502|nr:hypothetical protein [Sphingomonas sp. BAUL-RG-20F-R05-02]
MARKQALKVYRTPIGFHDAYVAAPSQKAALEAWGSTANLFARGIAEQVDDPGLIEEPLAQPGVVIRRSRGTTAEQIAALPPDPPRTKVPKTAAPKGSPRPSAPPRPKPSRACLEAAEQALTDAESQKHDALEEIARRESDLARDRARVEREAQRERDRLQTHIDAERESYEAALRAWRG